MKWAPANICETGRLWNRRSFLGAATAAGVLPSIGGLSLQMAGGSASLTKEQRDRMTPDQVIEELKKGNERFRAGKMVERDYRAEKRASASGQYPAAIVLGCVDSRVPAEIVFDSGIGDTFNARVAGNVANDDILGSMEFACGVTGAKLVLVLGHTACGAVKGAIDDVVMGNLTGLLARIKPAIAATKYEGERTSKNYGFVDAVAHTNVGMTIDFIRQRSSVLADLEKKGSIKIAGAMYNLADGVATFDR